jgi:hypothetical protein
MKWDKMEFPTSNLNEKAAKTFNDRIPFLSFNGGPEKDRFVLKRKVDK